MKEIPGPIPCALCALQVHNDEMAMIEDKYVCRSCVDRMVANETVLVKTLKDNELRKI